MQIIIEKDKIQSAAIKAWVDNNKKGTILLPPGFGKNMASLKAVHTLPKGSTIIFLAEVSNRKDTFFKEVDKYEKLFGSLSDYIIKFSTYQAAYRWENKYIDMLICDEVDVMGIVFFNVFKNNTIKYALGMSGTTSDHIIYDDGKSKLDLIQEFMPIVYSYDIPKGVTEGLSRKMNIYLIHHDLNKTDKVIQGGSKKVPFKTTEQKQYEYLSKSVARAMYMPEPAKTGMMRASTSKRAKLLYTLPSKIPVVKTILKLIKGKSILFNNDLDILHDLVPTISSRNSKDENKRLMDVFEKGLIPTIGSFKLATRGNNFNKLANVILMSYYGNSSNILQMLGRLRVDGTKIGNVFIIITKNTKEVDWFNKFADVFNTYDVFNTDSSNLHELETLYNKYN